MKIYSDYKTVEAIQELTLCIDAGWSTIELDITEYLRVPNFIGFYSDVTINGVYKNNLTFTPNEAVINSIVSPIILKPCDINIQDCTNTQDIIKRVSSKYLLYRVPLTLFNFSSQT